ncbi:MAG: PHP domain-containing protein [Bacillota bacterium]
MTIIFESGDFLMTVDLHIHTTASDGSLSPKTVVKKAKKLNYNAISITDHDTIKGLEEAIKTGNEIDLEVIPGIEFNTKFNGYEVHILGYFINYKNKKLLNETKKIQNSRIKRVKKIIEKLNEIGFNITRKEVFSLSNGGAIGRSHIAHILKKKGYVRTFSEAFDKYLAIGKIAYVERYRLKPQEAINLINEVDGIPVLAHPGLINNDEIVEKIVEIGVKGIEAYYYEHNSKETNKYIEYAKNKNLLITGGSDDHGPGNKDGMRLGKVKLDYELVENLKSFNTFVFQ